MCVLIYADKPVKDLFVAKKTGGLGDDQMVLMDDLNLQPESVIYYNLFNFLKKKTFDLLIKFIKTLCNCGLFCQKLLFLIPIIQLYKYSVIFKASTYSLKYIEEFNHCTFLFVSIL